MIAGPLRENSRYSGIPMGISRAIVILALAGSSVPAQLRDPRTSDGLQSVVNSIHPRLAVTGSYYTDINSSAGSSGLIG